MISTKRGRGRNSSTRIITNFYRGADLVGYMLNDKSIKFTEWDDFAAQVKLHTHVPFQRGELISINTVFGTNRVNLRVQIRTLIDGDPSFAKNIRDFVQEWGDTYWLIVGEHLWNPVTKKYMTW